ncbi:MAG: TrmH family RNA methyltransferase [Spirochaetales bacterium]|nr:TrmH family RNA methyltransferase [Spirochaetales bacterium]
MFSIKKLDSLPHRTRLRKIALILQEALKSPPETGSTDFDYLFSICDAFKHELPDFLSAMIIEGMDKHKRDNPDLRESLRLIGNIAYGIRKHLGAEPAEWDMTFEESGILDSEKRTVYPLKVFLEDLRSPFNVGAIFRTAESFGIAQIYLTPLTPLPTHKKALKTSRGCTEVIPWSVMDLSFLRTSGEDIFALELGGTDIGHFDFPESGIALIGSEELGLSPEALNMADQSRGRVSIPLFGAKQSLNVANAFGIMAYNWFKTVHTKLNAGEDE